MEGIILVKKNLALLLVLMLVIGSLAGCSSAPAEEPMTEAPSGEATTEEPAAEDPADEPMAMVEQTLIWNIGSEPKTIDPGLNAASDGGDVINNMFEGLMREVNGKLEPGMAESYTISDDKMVYTFTLGDRKWSDGQPVTAYDFEYAWNRVLDPETASEYSWIFAEANVDTFRAIDEDIRSNTESSSSVLLGSDSILHILPCTSGSCRVWR
jgi:oligopeptide transport system substrate-binding protein